MLMHQSRFLGQRSTTRPPITQASGFTLLETLMAIVAVSVVLIAITPPIVMVAASRVQTRRAEQALQVAQAEIDAVRTIVERGVYSTAELPADIGANINNVAAPNSVSTLLKSINTSCNSYTGTTINSTTLLPVDITGDCRSDFLVQIFRTTGPAGASTPTTGFKIGVRVYADIPNLRQNLGNLQTTQATLKFTRGLGQQNARPMAVLYSTLIRSDTNNSLRDYGTVCSTPGAC
ncbi:MAG: hypothetical protein KME16_09185 [Scytolyngbya sp. HA4215-MV1]|jgi:type II secretory pathway pseudopilin PulG|nr:hypothetical protein [Scytolyngbya sp. HA4215-MV1]